MEARVRVSPVYRYGILFCLVACLAGSVYIGVMTPPEYGGNSSYISVLLTASVLFTHLLGFFRWPGCVSVVLWMLALGSLAFGLFYLCSSLVRIPSP
jgi:hypothetical protein